jgi:hypothetical protein
VHEIINSTDAHTKMRFIQPPKPCRNRTTR